MSYRPQLADPGWRDRPHATAGDGFRVPRDSAFIAAKHRASSDMVCLLGSCRGGRMVDSCRPGAGRSPMSQNGTI